VALAMATIGIQRMNSLWMTLHDFSSSITVRGLRSSWEASAVVLAAENSSRFKNLLGKPHAANASEN